MRPATISLFLVACLVLSSGEPQGGESGGGRDDLRPPAPANGTGAGSGGPGGGGPGGPGGGGPGGPGGEGGMANNAAGQPNNGTEPPHNGTGPANNGTGQGPRPRGDDPRTRNWGAPNARNETEFDDRKSPRKVAFLGKSANIRIYPNYSDTSVYLQLRFGRIAELDAAGRRVPEHTINSLADSSDSIVYSAGNLTYNGVNMSYVNITLNPQLREEFAPVCRGPGFNGSDDDADRPSRPPRPASHRRSLLQDATPPAPSGGFAPRISVSLLFGMDDVVVLPYGSNNVTVPRNGLKWTVAYENWPFCNDTHTLSMALDLLLANNATAQISQAASGDIQTLSLALGSSYNASLSFYDYAMDSARGSIRMPARTNITQNGGLVSVNMILPNPKSYNVSTVYYDPTQTTVTAFLDSTDPGNGYISTTQNGTTGNDNGAAGSLRVTFWAAVAAVLLSALLVA